MYAGFNPGDLIWILVIVASIIGQFLKTAKTMKKPGQPPAPPPPAPRAGGSAPRDELEDFLRTLMGEQTKSALPPKPPPPPVARPVRPPVAAAMPPPRPQSPRPLAAPRPMTVPPVVAAHTRPAPARHVRAVPVPQPVRPPPRPPEPSPAQLTELMSAAMRSVPAIGLAAPSGASCSETRRELLRMFRSRAPLRSAILMREILGPPIALQPQGAGRSYST